MAKFELILPVLTLIVVSIYAHQSEFLMHHTFTKLQRQEAGLQLPAIKRIGIKPQRPPRVVALCFFGLTRSLSVTRSSLRRHVLDVLTSHGWAYDIFLHTYRKETLTNPRSNEAKVDLDTDEWRYLRPARLLIEDGDKIDAEHVKPLLPKVLTRGDLWRESNVNHSSMANLLSQLRSIEQVTGLLMREQQITSTAYDAVVFLRPDVWFFNDIDMREVESARTSPNVMFIPEFHTVANKGEFNDRFAICHPETAKVWGLRRRLVENYVFIRNQTLHSERLLGHALRQANITVKPSRILFGRVRANKVLWGQPENGTMVVKPVNMSLNAMGSWRI
jgi:hypothetical protein